MKKFGILVALAAAALSMSASATVPVDKTAYASNPTSPATAAPPTAKNVINLSNLGAGAGTETIKLSLGANTGPTGTARHDYTIKTALGGTGNDMATGTRVKKNQGGGTVPRHPAGGQDVMKIVASGLSNGNLFFDKRTIGTGLGATVIGLVNGVTGLLAMNSNGNHRFAGTLNA